MFPQGTSILQRSLFRSKGELHSFDVNISHVMPLPGVGGGGGCPASSLTREWKALGFHSLLNRWETDPAEQEGPVSLKGQLVGSWKGEDGNSPATKKLLPPPPPPPCIWN